MIPHGKTHCPPFCQKNPAGGARTASGERGTQSIGVPKGRAPASEEPSFRRKVSSPGRPYMEISAPAFLAGESAVMEKSCRASFRNPGETSVR